MRVYRPSWYNEFDRTSHRLTANIPVRCKPYVVPYSVRKSLQEDIQRMIDMNVIRPSESPYSLPVVVVRKHDETNRICIDYHRLNRMTLPDSKPMTSMPTLTQKFGKSKYFSKLDLSKGYWQIAIAKEDVFKTAFVTPDRCYECLRMPFGMMNSGATLVRAMRKLFQGLAAVDSYVDDTIVHAPTWQEHIVALRETLDRIAKAGLTVRPSKCLIGPSLWILSVITSARESSNPMKKTHARYVMHRDQRRRKSSDPS